MDWERLHGSVGGEMSECLQFHVLLGKSALECYKSLKEDLRTHAFSYETVCQWVNAIKNDWEERDNAPHSGAQTSVMDECHVE
jgi:hypothetical protein